MWSLLGILAGCGGNGAQQGGTPQGGSGPSSNSDHVGLNMELSGGVASYGTNSKDGAMLAIEEINQAGGVLGKQLNPIVKDCKSLADEAMSASALAAEGIVAQIGPLTSGNVQEAP